MIILDEDRCEELPEGSIIVSSIKEYSGMYTLIRSGVAWFTFVIVEDQLELEELCTPESPSLLVLYGDPDEEEGQYEPFGPTLALIPGGKDKKPE